MASLRLGSGRVHALTPRVVRYTRVFFLGVASVLACIGAFFVVMGTREWVLASQSTEWPSTSGIVLESVVRTSRHASTGRSGRIGSSAVSHNAHVRYRYQVDGVDYESDRLSYRVKGEGESGARSVAQRYPADSTVTVYYNPAAPGTSVLETGWDWYSVIPVGVGVFAVAFCAFFSWMVLRVTRRMMGMLGVTATPES